MAEGKKSVLLYCDLIHTVEKMDDETAGKFFKHYLRYINDQDPVTDNQLIDIVFEPVKQSLKRDLKKWDGIREKRSKAGLASAKKRKQKATNSTRVKSVQHNSTSPTVSVSVNGSVNVNDILLEKETKGVFNDWLEYRKEIKKPIKSERSLISLAKKMQTEGAARSFEVVQTSIENQWQGLFWNKKNELKNEPTINRQTAETITSNSKGWGA